MYICKIHGSKKSDWCEQCEAILICDCSDKEMARFRDLTFETLNGYRSVTVNINFCNTCGKVFRVKC